MTKLDPSFTKKLQDWLSTPADQRDYAEGATMLLQLTRNRALYNTICRRPDKYAAKIEYELRKFLNMRIHDVAVADVAAMQARVMPQAQETLASEPVISTDDEMPVTKKNKGRRADHDQLPEHIQDLWNKNLEQYRRIKLLYSDCVAMTDAKAQPCDIYEKLQLLAEADKKYRDNLAAYDAYVIGSEVEVDKPDEKPVEIARRISAARKTLSKYRKVYAKTPNLTTRDNALAKIQECVSTILAAGADFAPDTRAELAALGIVFEE